LSDKIKGCRGEAPEQIGVRRNVLPGIFSGKVKLYPLVRLNMTQVSVRLAAGCQDAGIEALSKGKNKASGIT
jgi:hypothetical protein